MSSEWDDSVMVIHNVVVVAKTSQAVLCESDELNELDEKDRWLPFSQIDFSSEITRRSKKGDTGMLIISNWIAEQKGLR